MVIPILTFGSPVWFTGVKQNFLIKPLERAQSEGLRWMLGAFRTSPVAELGHMAAILQIPHFLRKLSTNAAIRFRCLPLLSQVLARTPLSWGIPPPDGFLSPLLDPSPGKPATIIH